MTPARLQNYLRECRKDHPALLLPGWDQTAQAVDQSGAGNHGTYTGGYVQSVDGPFAGARGFRLDGSTGFAQVPDAAALRLSSGGWACGWANLATVSNTQSLIQKDGGAGGYSFGLISSKLFVYCGSLVSGNATLVVGQWFFWSVVYAGSSSAIYLNGQLDATASINTPDAGSTTILGVGAKVSNATELVSGTMSLVEMGTNPNISPTRFLARYRAARG